MPPSSLVELKRALVREGFEIYRTAGHLVLLAERVRDNLIMDSGVALGWADGDSEAQRPTEQQELLVRIVLRAQATEFPGENAERLIDRARQLAAPFEERGYQEADTRAVQVKDPGDEARTLDTWHEVCCERTVQGFTSALTELRFALEQKKTAGGDPED